MITDKLQQMLYQKLSISILYVKDNLMSYVNTGFASGYKYIVVEASTTDGKIDKRFRSFVYRTYKFEACREMKSDGIMVKGE
jgi:hypothetical protein